jgi:hypothetical protein
VEAAFPGCFLFAEIVGNQLAQSGHGFLFVRAVGQQRDGRALDDPEGQHLAFTRRSSFSTQMPLLNSLAF